MKVRYSPVVATIYLVLGVLLLVLHLYVMGLTRKSDATATIRLIVPVMLIIIGAMYFSRVYFEVKTNELVIYAPLGFVARTYNFKSYDDFVVEGKKVFVNNNGKLTRVRINKSTAHAEQWKEFISMIEGGDLTRELHNVDR